MKTIEGLESGAQSFITLYEDIKGRNEDIDRLLEDYYSEQYKYVKEMIEDD